MQPGYPNRIFLKTASIFQKNIITWGIPYNPTIYWSGYLWSIKSHVKILTFKNYKATQFFEAKFGAFSSSVKVRDIFSFPQQLNNKTLLYQNFTFYIMKKTHSKMLLNISIFYYSACYHSNCYQFSFSNYIAK